MLRRRLVNLAMVLAVLISADPDLAVAQEGDMFVSVTPTEGQCPTDAYVVGYIGYKDLECNCSFTIAPDGPRRYDFRAEPTLGSVESGSPADGKLRAGDVIAAIDGHLITTREGGRRFASLTPGELVTLTVRRQGREVDVTMVPERACYEVTALPQPRVPALPRTTVAPDVPRPNLARPVPPRRPTVVAAEPPRPTTPVPPPVPDLSHGWFGFSFKCIECTFDRSNGRTVWGFTAPPEVDRVESGSPAHEAGLRAGDRLTHINGYALTSPEGGRLFMSVESGDTVTFRYSRNNSTRDARIITETRTQYLDRQHMDRWNQLAADYARPPSPPITRFSGVVGNAHVLVTGGPVSVNRTEDEVVIQAGDITVRVRRTGTPPN
jgi:membrane-associated protease RseP (regulator of RpoE activity)